MKKFLFTLLLSVIFCSCSFSQQKGQVYIAGSDGSEDDGDAVYWLNGQGHVLPKRGGVYIKVGVSTIAISGKNVYIAGSDGMRYRADDGSLPIDPGAVYWLNGKRHVLPKTGNRASANAIAISGSDVYIAGSDGSDDGRDAVYWLNGQRHILPKTGSYAGANAIAISGSNIYISGYDGSEGDGNAVYWLNGQRHALPKAGSYAGASAIVIVP